MQTSSNGIKHASLGVVRVLVPGVALAIVGAVGVGLWRVLADVAAAWRSGAPTTPATALLGALALVGLALLAWLVLGAVLEALARVPGAVGRAAAGASAALSPRVVRRATALVLGVGIGAGMSTGGAQAQPRSVVAVAVDAAVGTLGGPATSGGVGVGLTVPDPSWAPGARTGASGAGTDTEPAGPPDPGWTRRAAAHRATDASEVDRGTPDPGWTPDRPRVRPQPELAVLAGRARSDDDGARVVVHRGDTLWSIAARELGEGATDAEIAAAWPHWYTANRAVVGPDPDVIRPGQVLRVPTVAAETASEVGS